MANTKSKTKKPAADAVQKTATAVETEVQEDAVLSSVEEKKLAKARQDLDPRMYVTVKNGFHGTLVYRSKKTGERFVWDAFGDEQEMELSELKSAKNSYKQFFINNWFLFDDHDVIEWLGVNQYYKHALNSESFDKLFEKSPKEIEKTIKELSDGQKKSLAFRAKELIEDGVIDSRKTIAALEKSLSVELTER